MERKGNLTKMEGEATRRSSQAMSPNLNYKKICRLQTPTGKAVHYNSFK